MELDKNSLEMLTVVVAVSNREETEQISQVLTDESDFSIEDKIFDGFLLEEKLRVISPDILVLDYHLKNIDMGRFLEESQNKNPSMTIILLVNKDDSVDLLLFHRASLRNIISRPIDYPKLPGIMRNALLHSYKKIKARSSSYGCLHQGIVIAFSSAKGGVGKSFVSSNLSLVLGNLNRNYKVVLLDFALPYGDQRAIFGIPPAATQSVLDLVGIAEEITPERIKSVAVNSPVYPNVDVILSSHKKELQENFARAIPKVMKSLRQVYDFIIVDLNPGITEVSRPILEKADRIMLLFTPEIPSIYRLIHLLKDFQWLKIHHPPEIIYNRRSKKADRDVGALLSKVLPYKIFATISEDFRTASHSLNYLTPAVTRKSPIRKDILALSQQILEWHEYNQQEI